MHLCLAPHPQIEILFYFFSFWCYRYSNDFCFFYHWVRQAEYNTQKFVMKLPASSLVFPLKTQMALVTFTGLELQLQALFRVGVARPLSQL